MALTGKDRARKILNQCGVFDTAQKRVIADVIDALDMGGSGFVEGVAVGDTRLIIDGTAFELSIDNTDPQNPVLDLVNVSM